MANRLPRQFPTAGQRQSRSCVGRPRAAAFTLIELILVMTLLTIAVSMTAPVLSRFFRGRALDSEARRLLALTRIGQSRAVCEGVPMDLWVNAPAGTFGLEAEPSYEDQDPKAISSTIDSGLQILASEKTQTVVTNTMTRIQSATAASVPKVRLTHPDLPTIRFLPDGSISDTSPQTLRLIASDGSSLWLGRTRNRLNYEIRNTEQ